MPKTALASSKKKNCTKGWACGGTCLSHEKKTCLNPLQGQSATYADWLAKNKPPAASKAKVNPKPVAAAKPAPAAKASKPAPPPTTPKPAEKKVAADGFPPDADFIAAINQGKTEDIQTKKKTYNAGGLYKVTIDGKDYFVKKTKGDLAHQAELSAYEVSQKLGISDKFLATKVVKSGNDNYVVTPFVADINPPNRGEYLKKNSISLDDATQMATADFLIGNRDRHFGNIIQGDGKLLAIDHEFSLGNPISDLDKGIIRPLIMDNPYLAYAGKYHANVSPDTDAWTARMSISIDAGVVRRAVSTLPETLTMLRDRGLKADSYEKRVRLLEKVVNSNNPTFGGLYNAMGFDNW